VATTAIPEHVLSPDPSEQDELVELREQLARIAARRERPVARLVSPDGSEVEIPASAFAALQAVVRDMAQGLTITLIPHDKELTTKEAADILNTSRPFLVTAGRRPQPAWPLDELLGALTTAGVPRFAEAIRAQR
jgi:hypothetical protein